ncbi:MAG: molybdopterin-dependent oxidoreductase [Actinobacteria bacterium]|nr:molybdopterin-dependent oxidoreductase [Actinomycetota bacterium]
MAHRVSGVIAAGVALGAAELLSGVFERIPSLVESVGQAVINLSPAPMVRFGISAFGTNDKPALAIGIVVISLLLGGMLGAATAKRRMVAPVALGAFALVGLAAAVYDTLTSGGWAIPACLAAVAAGTATLWWLLAAAELRASTDIPAAVAAEGRRRFVLGSAAGLGAAVAFPVIGRQLSNRFSVESARADVELATTAAPQAAAVAVAVDPASDIEGLSTLYTSNSSFYRIDTAFTTPQVDPATWTLKIEGAVDQEVEITFDELVSMATTEADVTLSCVSNRVGGGLVGNAQWLGVPLTDLLDEAGVQPEGNQIFSRSVDGWTCGFPTSLAYDGRSALVAVGMNGEPLPVAHGFPARLVIAGLYGYVSATKWLERITLTDWDSNDGYWIPRGWSKEGPIKTQARIDTASQRSGTDIVSVAGVAWAPTRGISKVELSFDQGPWVETELGPALSEETWRQWWYDWTGAIGSHEVRVRATDGTGAVQTSEVQQPAPNGATGNHEVQFSYNA